MISAKDRSDVAWVREVLISFFDGELVEDEVFVPYERHALVRRIHDSAIVLGERYDEAGTHVRVRAPKAAIERLRQTGS